MLFRTLRHRANRIDAEVRGGRGHDGAEKTGAATQSAAYVGQHCRDIRTHVNTEPYAKLDIEQRWEGGERFSQSRIHQRQMLDADSEYQSQTMQRIALWHRIWKNLNRPGKMLKTATINNNFKSTRKAAGPLQQCARCKVARGSEREYESKSQKGELNSHKKT